MFTENDGGRYKLCEAGLKGWVWKVILKLV